MLSFSFNDCVHEETSDIQVCSITSAILMKGSGRGEIDVMRDHIQTYGTGLRW
jgi:hypothetical protein